MTLIISLLYSFIRKRSSTSQAYYFGLIISKVSPYIYLALASYSVIWFFSDEKSGVLVERSIVLLTAVLFFCKFLDVFCLAIYCFLLLGAYPGLYSPAGTSSGAYQNTFALQLILETLAELQSNFLNFLSSLGVAVGQILLVTLCFRQRDQYYEVFLDPTQPLISWTILSNFPKTSQVFSYSSHSSFFCWPMTLQLLLAGSDTSFWVWFARVSPDLVNFSSYSKHYIFLLMDSLDFIASNIPEGCSFSLNVSS